MPKQVDFITNELPPRYSMPEYSMLLQLSILTCAPLPFIQASIRIDAKGRKLITAHPTHSHHGECALHHTRYCIMHACVLASMHACAHIHTHTSTNLRCIYVSILNVLEDSVGEKVERMYACVCVFVPALCARTHAHAHVVHIHTHTHMYMRTRARTHTHASIYLSIYPSIHPSIYLSMSMDMQ